jgi:hypothetical protein
MIRIDGQGGPVRMVQYLCRQTGTGLKKSGGGPRFAVDRLEQDVLAGGDFG